MSVTTRLPKSNPWKGLDSWNVQLNYHYLHSQFAFVNDTIENLLIMYRVIHLHTQVDVHKHQYFLLNSLVLQIYQYDSHVYMY